MEFRTAYNHHQEVFQPSGEEVEIRHREVVKKDGTTKLVQDVPVNIWEKIQAQKDECDIKKILERAMGNINAIPMVEKTYMDLSNMPETWAEAQSNLHRVEQDFAKLPKDVRSKFDNDYRKYIAQFGTEKWIEDTGLKAKWEEDKRKTENARLNNELTRKALENMANMKGSEA